MFRGMNILLVNQPWFASELKNLGHTVVSCGMEGNLDVIFEGVPIGFEHMLSMLPSGFLPDVIVWNDNSSPFFLVGAEESQIPIVFISIDTHHHSRWHKYLGHLCDKALVGQKDYMLEFEEVGVKPVWYPLWSSRYVEASDKKEYGACFIGSFNPDLNPERIDFFNRLKEKVPVFLTSGQWWDYFPHSEIVINQTVKKDLNFRVFEAMMCGSMLLTEKSGNGLYDLFEEGVHLLSYEKGDADEAAAIIKKCLSDLSTTRKIAAAGRAEVVAKHSPLARAKDLLTIITDLKRTHSPRRYFSSSVVYSVAGRALKKIDVNAALPLFDSALRCAVRGLHLNEEVDESVASEIIYSCMERDALTREPVGQSLLYSLSDKYEDQPFFTLAAVRGLLNEGRIKEAEALSTARFPAPKEEVFRIAEETVTSIRDSGKE